MGRPRGPEMQLGPNRVDKAVRLDIPNPWDGLSESTVQHGIYGRKSAHKDFAGVASST